MSKKKKGGGGGGGDWLGTYSDMVTLLMCFFVLLYSMSSIDSVKWQVIVKSFNPSAEYISQVVVDTDANPDGYDVSGGSDAEESSPADVANLSEFDQLYEFLKEYVESQGLETDMEVAKGDGFTFITFRNNVFFDGDSYILKPAGKEILDDLSVAIGSVSSSISEIQILGHTSQASPTEPNEVEGDRFLSSNRAAEVLVYMQKKNIIEPGKLISSGFGQFRPVSSFETRESRAANRRVEIIITKDEGVENSLETFYRQVYGDEYLSVIQ